jgi:hypothetical protein
VKISITDSAQVLAAQEFTTTPQNRAGKNEWSLSRESSMYVVGRRIAQRVLTQA